MKNKEGEETVFTKELKKNGIFFREKNEEIYDFAKQYENKETILNIISSRYKNKNDLKKYYETRLSDILSLDFLSKIVDIDKSTDTILKHMMSNNRILLVSDNDMDGFTSAVVGKLMFDNVIEYKNVEVLINKRKYGNGINDILKEQIVNMHGDEKFDLIILSDHGSANRESLGYLKDKLGIDVIVTDHHLFKEDTYPNNVEAFINVQCEGNEEFKNISGTAILYFTLLHLYYSIHPEKNLEIENKIYYYLTYVGLTTISDSMVMNNYINKKIVIKALEILNNKKFVEHNAFWRLMLKTIGTSYFITEETLSFSIIPILNSPGRIDNPRIVYEMMTTNNDEFANEMFDKSKAINDVRKDRQNKAYNSKDKLIYKNDLVCVMFEKKSTDVQGILASKILNDSGVNIAIVFSGNPYDDYLHGSGRMIDNGSSLKMILEELSKRSDIIITSGGHAGAAGLKIKNDVERFYKELMEVINDLIEKGEPIKSDDRVLVDGYIYSNRKLITTIFDVKKAGPYGVGYTKPVFVSDVSLIAYRIFSKKDATYMSLTVKLSNQSNLTVNGFYTIPNNVKDDFLEDIVTKKNMRIVYSLNINSYMSKNKINLNVDKLILL